MFKLVSGKARRWYTMSLMLGGTTCGVGGMSCQQAADLFKTGFSIGQQMNGGSVESPHAEPSGDDWYSADPNSLDWF